MKKSKKAPTEGVPSPPKRAARSKPSRKTVGPREPSPPPPVAKKKK